MADNYLDMLLVARTTYGYAQGVVGQIADSIVSLRIGGGSVEKVAVFAFYRYRGKFYGFARRSVCNFTSQYGLRMDDTRSGKYYEQCQNYSLHTLFSFFGSTVTDGKRTTKFNVFVR